MIINGRVINFAMTVGASIALSVYCDKDINNFPNWIMLDDCPTIERFERINIAALAMSEAYEEREKLMDPDYEKKPLKAKELLCMNPVDFPELAKELYQAYIDGISRTVEVDHSKNS